MNKCVTLKIIELIKIRFILFQGRNVFYLCLIII